MSQLFPCPACGGPATKAMYCGLPFKLCGDEECAYCWGPFAFLFDYDLIPFNGWFIRYENYWSALWEFLTGQSAEKADRL